MRLQLLPPGEGQQPPDELATLLGRALGHAKDAQLFVVEVGASFDQLKPPMTAARRLLKSCAMPPVSLPIASIFCAWINWLSSDRCS